MNDKQVYNVVVLTPEQAMGELCVIAKDDKDCLEAVDELNQGYRVLSYNNLATFKQKVLMLEKAKDGLVPSLKSFKMQS